MVRGTKCSNNKPIATVVVQQSSRTMTFNVVTIEVEMQHHQRCGEKMSYHQGCGEKAHQMRETQRKKISMQEKKMS